MPRLTIDNRDVEVPDGATVLQAARKLGLDIPALCFREGCQPNTSCMACVVKVDGRAGLVPSCATRAVEGMRVQSETDEIRQARRTALELLLSDHLGDCIGPCHTICPAHMNIPRMIRQIAAGDLREAIETVKADIALPAVLGRICPAPCEKGCRRGQIDQPVAICLLKRHAADVDLASGKPYRPPCAPDSGKAVAIVGAGPTGMAGAYYLRRLGHACTVFDDHADPGGMLRYGVPPEQLDWNVLFAEVRTILELGVELRLGTRVGGKLALSDLRRGFDAVLVAAGAVDQAQAEALGLAWDGKSVAADRQTFRTPTDGVFAACGARQQKLAVRAVADGKTAAGAIDQFLRGQPVTGEGRAFTVRIGKLRDEEKPRFLAEASDRERVTLAREAAGLDRTEALAEAQRCLHCDCRRTADCALRQYAAACDASPVRYKIQRRTFEQCRQHAEVIFEPGKCIDCGLCVQIAARAGEKLGLAFVGRGFDVRVAVPFDGTLAEGLAKAAAECVAACPTGALAYRQEPKP